jgi:hypothetical protein
LYAAPYGTDFSTLKIFNGMNEITQSITFAGLAGAMATPLIADDRIFTEYWTLGPTGNSVLSTGTITYATWDAAKFASGSVRLTGVNLVASFLAGSAYVAVGGTIGKSAGIWSFVVTVPSVGWNGFVGIDAPIGGTGWWTTTGFWIGSTVRTNVGEGIALFPLTNGFYHTDSRGFANAASGGTNTEVAILVVADLNAGNVYFYNYTAATLIGTYAFAGGMTVGDVFYPVAAMNASPDAVTLNCGQTAITLPAAMVTLGANAYWGT